MIVECLILSFVLFMHNPSPANTPSSAKNSRPFTLATIKPEDYRQQTRKATWIIIAVFVALAMLLSSLLVMFFGEPGGDNFRLNMAGVAAGVAITAVLVRVLFSKQPWMAANVYGWRLKRSLMSITNVMHHVTHGVTAKNPSAIKLLRFYHLGLLQMHDLDGNTSEISQMVHEVDAHKQCMQELGIDCEQQTLDPAWIQAVKTK
jgi:hypothetical protein